MTVTSIKPVIHIGLSYNQSIFLPSSQSLWVFQ